MLVLKKSVAESKRMIGVSSFAAHLSRKKELSAKRCAAKNRV